MEDTFVDLCEKGKLDEIKEMYRKCNINICSNTAFINSCYYGHLNIVQWLYSLGGMNIHADKDNAFRISCGNGHLNVAQWLYSLGDVNISACRDDAFISSCNGGYLNVAMWLYSLGGIDIHNRGDLAFVYCCWNDHIESIRWLLSIDKFDDKMVDNKLSTELYEYAFSLGYLPINNMVNAYVDYKNKIKDKIKENNNVIIFELGYLVDIILIYI